MKELVPTYCMNELVPTYFMKELVPTNFKKELVPTYFMKEPVPTYWVGQVKTIILHNAKLKFEDGNQQVQRLQTQSWIALQNFNPSLTFRESSFD